MIVLGREMKDAVDYVPHLHMRGGRAQWSALEASVNMFMPVSKDMKEKARELRSVSRQLVDARDDSVIPQADDAARREIEQVHLLNKMLDDRCRTLQEERDRLQQLVKQLEDGIVNEHVRRLIETRRQEEEEKLRRTSAEQIASAREAYRTQFASEMESARQRRETEARQLEAQRAQAAADYAVVRGEMGDDLTKLVQLLQGQMDKWQKALDGSECRMLAQSYAALHGLWTKALARVIVDAQFTSADEVVMNGLVQLHGDLRDRLVQLEQAMLRLGLTVIRPEAGETFDGVYHVPAGTSAGAVGESRITRCLHPGVMAQSGEVLIRAEVELG